MTAYELRISDWSSDVCSSDLACAEAAAAWLPQAIGREGNPGTGRRDDPVDQGLGDQMAQRHRDADPAGQAQRGDEEPGSPPRELLRRRRMAVGKGERPVTPRRVGLYRV